MDKIINLIKEIVVVIDEDKQPIISFEKFDNTLDTTSFFKKVKIKDILGVPVFKTKYYNVNFLPEYKEGFYYIVSLEIAQLAKEGKRKTEDLLIPDNIVEIKSRSNSTAIFCKNFKII